VPIPTIKMREIVITSVAEEKQSICGRKGNEDLCLVGELNDESADGQRGLVGVVIVDALGAHVPGEDAAVGSEAGDGDADVVVDLEDLLLVRGEFGVGLVDACENHVRLGSETDRRRALLHRLHRILHLEQPPRGAPCRHVRVVLVSEHSRFNNRTNAFPFFSLFSSSLSLSSPSAFSVCWTGKVTFDCLVHKPNGLSHITPARNWMLLPAPLLSFNYWVYLPNSICQQSQVLFEIKVA